MKLYETTICLLVSGYVFAFSNLSVAYTHDYLGLSSQQQPPPQLSAATDKERIGKQLLQRSNAFHDPNKKWPSANVSMVIVEPRLNNPTRMSNLTLNHAPKHFELTRNRGQNQTTHVIDSKGNSYSLLNGKAETNPDEIKEFSLDPKRNFNYRRVYELLIGLPSSLTEQEVANVGLPVESVFDTKKAWRIDVELKEPLFSKFWSVYLSAKDYRVLGIDIQNDEVPDRSYTLVFRDLVEIDGIKFPRVRHWYGKQNQDFRGSDIILKQVEK